MSLVLFFSFFTTIKNESSQAKDKITSISSLEKNKKIGSNFTQ